MVAPQGNLTLHQLSAFLTDADLEIDIAERAGHFDRAALALTGSAFIAPRAAFTAERVSLGEAELITLSDGHLTLPAEFIFGPAPQEALAALKRPGFVVCEVGAAQADRAARMADWMPLQSLGLVAGWASNLLPAGLGNSRRE